MPRKLLLQHRGKSGLPLSQVHRHIDLKPLIHKYFVLLRSILSRDLILTIVTFFNGKCLADFFRLSVAQTPILNACTKEEITRMSKEVIGRTTQAGVQNFTTGGRPHGSCMGRVCLPSPCAGWVLWISYGCLEQGDLKIPMN